MAWGSIGLIGNQGSSGATTTLVITATTPAVSNSMVVVTVARLNPTSVDGVTASITNVIDSASNDWVKAQEFQAGGTAANSGAICSIWYSNIGNTISSGGTITVNLASATSSRAAGAFGFSKEAGTVVRVLGSTYISATSAQSPLSLDIAIPTTTEVLRFRGIASESTLTTALTTSAGWTNIGTTRAGAASPMSYRGEFLITAATTAASNPTFTSTASDASVYVLFEECYGLMGTKSL
jgi:hypothetical protein